MGEVHIINFSAKDAGNEQLNIDKAVKQGIDSAHHIRDLDSKAVKIGKILELMLKNVLAFEKRDYSVKDKQETLGILIDRIESIIPQQQGKKLYFIRNLRNDGAHYTQSIVTEDRIAEAFLDLNEVVDWWKKELDITDYLLTKKDDNFLLGDAAGWNDEAHEDSPLYGTENEAPLDYAKTEEYFAYLKNRKQ